MLNYFRRQALRKRVSDVFDNPRHNVFLISLFAMVGLIIGLNAIFAFSGCHSSESEAEDVSDAHFTIELADDMKTDKRFKLQYARDNYKKWAFNVMNELYINFYPEFLFAPDHPIHIIISVTVDGVNNKADTTTTYSADGKISKLTMHFPYEMFNRESVRVHELTHAFIAQFHLPTWVDEGYAVFMEHMLTDSDQHLLFDSLTEHIRLDDYGVNAIQNWTEGEGIYADIDMTLWCYRYAHTLVDYIDKTYPGTFDTLFDKFHPHGQVSTELFVSVLDEIISDTDMKKFFLGLKFSEL